MSAATERKPETEYEIAVQRLKTAHESFINMDRRKLRAAKAAGDALTRIRRLKPDLTVDQLLHTLEVANDFKVSKSSYDRYVRVASNWKAIADTAKEKGVPLDE